MGRTEANDKFDFTDSYGNTFQINYGAETVAECVTYSLGLGNSYYVTDGAINLNDCNKPATQAVMNKILTRMK